MIQHPSPTLQEFGFTDMNQIVFEDDLCLDVAKHSAKAEINIQMCHFMGGNQKWNYDNKVRAGIACDAMVGEGTKLQVNVP